MFDQVVVRPRRRAFTTVLVVASALAHAAGVAVLAWWAVWQVEKVALGPDRPITIYQPKLQAGASLPEAGKLAPVKVDRVVKVKVKTDVQPPVTPPEPAAQPDPSSGAGGDQGPPGGTGGDGPPGPPDAPPCLTPPCDPDGEPTPPEPTVREPPVVEKEPPIVSVAVARGLRIAGTEQIYPDRTTQLAMMRAGTSELRATFQLCVDVRGTVSSVRTLRGTGHGAYDGALLDAMRGWRYRPYAVDGRPAPMCTVQGFVYRIKS